MSALLSRYLKDFGEPVVTAPPAAPAVDFSDDFGSFPDVALEPEVDVEAERRDANAEGHAKATAELTQKYEVEAQTIAVVHQREIEELKTRYETEIAILIASRIAAISSDVAELVSATVAEVLAPVLTETLSQKAAVDLAAALQEAILEGEVGTITVRGPASLFEIMQRELGDKAGLLRHQETTDIDLTAEFGESVLVTRMSAWAGSLKKVLE